MTRSPSFADVIQRTLSFGGRGTRREFCVVHFSAIAWSLTVVTLLPACPAPGDQVDVPCVALTTKLLWLAPLPPFILSVAKRRGNDIGWQVSPSAIAFIPALTSAGLEAAISIQANPAAFDLLAWSKSDGGSIRTWGGTLTLLLYIGLNCLPSQPGTNRFGANPLEATT